MTLRPTAIAFALSLSALAAVGCDNDTPAERKIERAGDKVENAAEKVGDATKDAANKAGDKIEEAGDKAKRAVD